MDQADNSKFVPALPDSDDKTVNIYEGVAECTMNDSDNLKTVKIKVKNLAQDNVQKKIADFVYSFLKHRLLTLPEDETLSIANEISNITGVKYNFIDSDDDNLTVRATVTAQLDSKDIMNYLIRFFKERAELKSQNEALRKEIEDLKRQLANTQPNNNQIAPKPIEKSKIDLAKQKYDEAWERFCLMDYNGAIKLYDEAIKLNPNVARFYQYRGSCYHQLGNNIKARADFDKAKELGL